MIHGRFAGRTASQLFSRFSRFAQSVAVDSDSITVSITVGRSGEIVGVKFLRFSVEASGVTWNEAGLLRAHSRNGHANPY